MYEWIADNGMTPYILVDAAAPDVNVPRSAIKDGRIVLNIAARAVAQLELGKDRVSFMARFRASVKSSKCRWVRCGHLRAGKRAGMMFPAEGQTPPTSTPDAAPKKTPHLRVVK